MKGIVLAGGTGSRLWPLTVSISKQLLPIYNKPLIFYPISTLMLAGIREILLITNKENIDSYKRLLGDGSGFGTQISYEIQLEPRGIPEALSIGEEYIGKDSVCLILGDNFFFGAGLGHELSKTMHQENDAKIFVYHVANPQEYGVLELNQDGSAKSITEKPEKPNSNMAITGLYMYPPCVIEKTKNLKLSKRGELEISDLNQMYLDEGRLSYQVLSRGTAWLDTGTFNGLLDAANFVRTIEDRQGLKIGDIFQIAKDNAWI